MLFFFPGLQTYVKYIRGVSWAGTTPRPPRRHGATRGRHGRSRGCVPGRAASEGSTVFREPWSEQGTKPPVAAEQGRALHAAPGLARGPRRAPRVHEGAAGRVGLRNRPTLFCRTKEEPFEAGLQRLGKSFSQPSSSPHRRKPVGESAHEGGGHFWGGGRWGSSRITTTGKGRNFLPSPNTLRSSKIFQTCGTWQL